MKKIPELLAPAGSFESLKSAINAGADAIYLSGKRFGARQFAENFTLTQIEESINYAHLRGVKVYITVNTLIKDRELLSAAEYLLQLYEMGADAVLIQDLGLASLARDMIPHLTLHASTQMTIHNREGVEWAQEMGFKRVVLARELSREEIKEINRSSDMELEIFLHGALCYCYSGQCLLSSFIGGRSGNRGMCAQPCRKPYNLVVGEKDSYGKPYHLQEISQQDNYLMSPKDLALYSNLDKVVDLGLSSLKIEGRMRSPEYVAVVVRTYRQALDKLKKGQWRTSTSDLETLQLAFNRGFTSGHLFKSKGKQLMGRQKPGHRGLYLGKVKQYNSSKKEIILQLKTITRPHKGDGLFFESSARFEASPEIGVGIDVEQEPRIKGDKLFLKVKKTVPVGSEAYLTRRHDLTKHVSATPNKTGFEKEHLASKAPLQLNISFKLDESNFPVLEGELNTFNGEKVQTRVVGKRAMEKAIKRPLEKNEIEKQLLKVGDKPFIGKITRFEYPGDLFLPLSELNKVRRNLIDEIELGLLSKYRPCPEDLSKAQDKLLKLKIGLKKEAKNESQRKYGVSSGKSKNKVIGSSPSPELSVYLDDLNNIKNALDAGFKRIYFEPFLITPEDLFRKCFSKNSEKIEYDTSYLTETLKEASTLCNDSNCDLIWKWPNISRLTALDFLKEIQNRIYTPDSSNKSSLNIMVGNPGLIHYIKNKYPQTEIYGSPALNVWNHHSVDYLSSFLSLITVSPELSYKDLKLLAQHNSLNKDNSPLELIVQGNMEALTSADCLISSDWLSKHQMKKFAAVNKFWGLKDSKNHVFPLNISSECETILSNSVETCLVDQVPRIVDSGIKSLAIDARGRTGKYIQKMGFYYQQAIQLAYLSYDTKNYNQEIDSLKKQIKKISNGGITTGNFLRGI